MFRQIKIDLKRTKEDTMRTIKLTILTIAALGISSIAFAAENGDPVATVILAIGDVQAFTEDETPHDLHRRNFIYENDIIQTANESYVKVRFIDNTVLSLEPNSEFVVEEYQYDSNDPENNKYFGKLVKGGFMVVTGAVANKDKANFKVESELVGLTVRGTCFGGNMSETFQFAKTTCGAVQVDNKYGSVLVGPSQPRHLVVSGQDGSLLTAADPSEVDKITQCAF